MDVLSLIPRHGKDTLRIGDSNELVVMENFGSLPKGQLVLENHGLAVFCTEGMAQFDYDGRTIQLRKNGLFLYMAHSIAENFMASVDFNCRQLWFSQSEMYDMNIHSNTGLPDLVFLKNNPMVSLNEAQADLLDSHFCLLCRIMRDSDVPIYVDIVRSLAGSLMLKILSLLRGNSNSEATISENSTSFHGRQLADRFIQLVEQSDGRIRRVDEFARMLNVTPKYLSRILMETISRRPSDMITFYTINAIERRLRFTSMTMQQIADDLKFATPSFFGKYVKEHLGMTPLEYRLKYQREQE